MIVLIAVGCVLFLIFFACLSQPEPSHHPQKVRSTPAVSSSSIYFESSIERLSNRPKPLKNPFQVLNHQVHIITTASKCVEFIRQMLDHCGRYPVIGLDCEWVTVRGVRQKVALLQLASKFQLCVLIRLFQMDAFPTELRELLANPKIYKVGVEVYYDGEKLFQDYGLRVHGTVDLRHLAKRLRVPGSFGLAGLTETVLGIRLNKDWRTSASDWQSTELSVLQREYAAKDAIVAMQLFERFNLNIPFSELHQYVDIPFRTKFNR